MTLRLSAVLAAVVSLRALTAAAQPAPTGRDPYMARIREAVQARAPAFRRCYEQALRRDPALTGRTEAMRFRVLPSGRVRAVAVRVVPRSREIERCMTGVLERITLPPHRGAPIDVTYPLTE